ncbi:leukocyte immunoglobulin-like receptor subfamily A member 3 [Notamacropus eugenii]|uniref:leukocyte immunoglobulin-like receptor subfamily A member 3 n=1 Tax=Notamacropus eugenii TaxID=9315 RepID=UPI003B67E672
MVPPCASDSVLVSLQSPLPSAAGTIMTHILSVLLCLGLCLGQRMRAQTESLPRPFLRAENSSLVPKGRSVTLRCQGYIKTYHYRLEKRETSKTEIMNVKASRREGEFHIPSATDKDAGTYVCLYKHSSVWSERSDPLELVVTGLYDPPTLSALPSPKVASGHNVTLQCQSESWYTMYALYKDGQQITQDKASPHGSGSQANFLIPAVNSTHEGTYQCYTFQSSRPQKWSCPSEPLVLRVTGTLSPSPDSEKMLFDPAPQDYTVGTLLRLSLAGLLLLLLGVLLAEAWGVGWGECEELRVTRIISARAVSGPEDEGMDNYKHLSSWSVCSDPLELVVTDTVLVRLQSPLPPAAGTIMTHILSVLLCLGLCLGRRMKVQTETLPRLFLRAENSSLVPKGRSVTLRCQGYIKTYHYRLEKKETSETETMNVKPSRKEGKFHILSVTEEDAGAYVCLYQHSSVWSEHSDPLELVVTGLYDPPFLSALPSPEVASGHNVTLQCQSELWYTMYALYKDGQQITQDKASPHGSGSQANFLIPAVNSTHEGTYQCYTFQSYGPQKWSCPSDPLVLRVTGNLSPSPDSKKMLFGLAAGISVGVSAFLTLLFLFLILLFCHQRWQHQTGLRNGSKEAEGKKTTRSSDPEEGTPLEETLFATVNDDRQTEETRQEDTAAPRREDLQEVTYAQLNLNSLKAGAKDPPHSGAVKPSLYAALRGAQPEPRGPPDEEAPPHSASAF